MYYTENIPQPGTEPPPTPKTFQPYEWRWECDRCGFYEKDSPAHWREMVEAGKVKINHICGMTGHYENLEPITMYRLV